MPPGSVAPLSMQQLALLQRFSIPLHLLILSCCVLLTACSVAPTRHEPLPLTERVPLQPIEQHEFVLWHPEQTVVGEPQVIIARYEDTFPAIARAYGLGHDELVAANPDVDPWLPGEGTPILLPSQYVLPEGTRQGVVLNVAAKRLFYFPPVAEGEPVRVWTFPTGIGRVGWATPLGDARIIGKAVDPSWYVPASVRREHAEKGDPLPAVVPPGPDNPLGRHALRLNMPGYLIHGTNKPFGVGMRVSHGCVRLYPKNIEQLYALVDVGEDVAIVNEPYLLTRRNNEFYLEAHAPLEDDALSPQQRLQALLSAAQQQSGVFNDPEVEAQLLAAAAAARGVPVRVRQEAIEQIPQRARLVHNIVPLARSDTALSDG